MANHHHHQAYEVLLNENMDTVRDADGNINTTVIQLALDLNKPIVILGEAVAETQFQTVEVDRRLRVGSNATVWLEGIPSRN